jgi:UDP-glucuronate decarboxylase
MRILVTGGCGFIGSHLCRKLLNEGHKVICLDNLFTGNKENIKDLLYKFNFEFIRHDIVVPIYLEIDQIYHLACPASPKFYQSNPIKTIKTNVLGTINMLGLAKRNKARILLSSTSEIYGNPEQHPQKEDYFGNVNPNGIRSCYDEGKRIAETLMCDYKREHGVDIRIARIFNTYGPYMDLNDGRIYCNFMKQSILNNDITVYGNGLQTRCLCYIDDMVLGLISLMNTNNINSPINLGSDKELSVLKIANIIKNEVSSNSKIIFKPLPEDDPLLRCPDITRAKDLLLWEPKTNLDVGIKKSLKWYKEMITNNLL